MKVLFMVLLSAMALPAFAGRPEMVVTMVKADKRECHYQIDTSDVGNGDESIHLRVIQLNDRRNQLPSLEASENVWHKCPVLEFIDVEIDAWTRFWNQPANPTHYETLQSKLFWVFTLGEIRRMKFDQRHGEFYRGAYGALPGEKKQKWQAIRVPLQSFDKRRVILDLAKLR